MYYFIIGCGIFLLFVIALAIIFFIVWALLNGAPNKKVLANKKQRNTVNKPKQNNVLQQPGKIKHIAPTTQKYKLTEWQVVQRSEGTISNPKSNEDNVHVSENSASNLIELDTVCKSSILTPRELKFYKSIKPLIPASMILQCKTRVEDVLKIKGKNRNVNFRQRNMIKPRHFDFVLCDADTLRPLCAIELDDSSHTNQKQIHGDNVKNIACSVARLPMIRIQHLGEFDTLQHFIKNCGV